MTILPNSGMTFTCRNVVVGGGGGDCVDIIPSTRDAAAIAVCAGEPGDAVVTFPGDYTSDPDYFTAACENYYGDFRMGLNASYYGNTPKPPWWINPATWIEPKGFVALNSSCPARITRQLVFDWSASVFGSTVVYTDITPNTFQASVIDDWNSTGAHGQRCIATPDGAQNQDVTCGGYLDCRFLFFTSGSSYYSECGANYLSENRTPISGVALLTDNGSNPNITGYGLLVNRVNGMLETVKWEDNLAENYTVLHSEAFVPAADTKLIIDLVQTCVCPYGSQDPTVVHPAYPKSGFIRSYVHEPTEMSATHVWESAHPTALAGTDGSLSAADFRSFGYGCLLTVNVDNGFNDNEVVYRDPHVRFLGSETAC